MEVLREHRETPPSFFGNLWVRRVPQYFGGYCLTVMGVVQFVDWIQNRFVLSPHLTNFVLVLFLTLIPAVVLVSYHHGMPGRQVLTFWEKVALILNLAVTLAVLYFMFQGKDLGKTSRVITVKDEDGKAIEKVVPKSQFRKNVALLYFLNNSGDPELDWLQFALADMIGFDLSQDTYLSLISGFHLAGEIRKAGHEPGDALPLTLQKKLAADYHKGFFVSGSFAKKGDLYTVSSELFKTKTGRLVKKREFEGPDLLSLIDEIAVALKRDLEIPEGHIAEITDLPAAELLTVSKPALRKFYLAARKAWFENDWEAGVQLFEEAVAEDPGFAIAYLNLFLGYQYSEGKGRAPETLQTLMDLLYKLPERQQYVVKANYYQVVKKDPDKALAVLKIWAELFPDDIQAHTALATIYVSRNQMKLAIQECEKVLELDPEQYDYLIEIGKLHRQSGNYQQAREFFGRYSKEFPSDPGVVALIGDVFLSEGNHEQAKAHYEKACLLSPEETEFQIRLAELSARLGNSEESERLFNQALEAAKTPKDRHRVLKGLTQYCKSHGQLARAIDFKRQDYAELVKYTPPLLVAMSKLGEMSLFVEAGRQSFALEELGKIEEGLSAPVDGVVHLGYLDYYLAVEDVPRAKEAVSGLTSFIDTMKIMILKPALLDGKARIHELEGNFEEAVRLFKEEADLDPSNAEIHRNIGRCFRKAERYPEAEAALTEMLRINPFDPETCLEMFLVQRGRGNHDQALTFLERAIEGWEKADPNFEPAQQARSYLETLRAGSP